MHIKISCAFLFMFLSIITFPLYAYAAEEYTITYESMDGIQISREVVQAGSSVRFPLQTDVFLWLYDDCRKAEEPLMPEKDMVIKCIYNTDISEHGTLDGGNIIWFIMDRTLYVTGEGTIFIADKYNTGTKKYGFSIGTFKAENPSVMYEWQKDPEIGDEKKEGYGVNVVPDGKRTVEINVSRPIAFAGETIGVPATALMDAAPWSNFAGEIETVYISDDITLAGNFTAYFNLNSQQITPTAIQESRFRNLKTVYLYADTSAITGQVVCLQDVAHWLTYLYEPERHSVGKISQKQLICSLEIKCYYVIALIVLLIHGQILVMFQMPGICLWDANRLISH